MPMSLRSLLSYAHLDGASVDTGAAVVVASAAALCEKVPDPELRPHGFAIQRGGLLDLDETAAQLVACGYERVDQVEDRGQFAIRGDILDVYPATEERAVRCELFDVEVERLTFFSTFTQRSLEEAEQVEIAPSAEIGPEHRELAEIAAHEDPDERPDVAELLPVDRFRDLLSLVPGDALLAVAAEEELQPSLADLWQDVTTSFHDSDAHHLYIPPDSVRTLLEERAALWLSAISGDQPHQFRAQGADTAARNLREAEPELEKLVRSGYRTVVAWARRGEAERAAYNLARVKAAFLDGKPAPQEPGLTFAAASLREGFLAPGLKLAILPEHRLLRRGRAERRAAQALAGELINLYAERRRRAGHGFPQDTDWQVDFEQAFAYQETPDQLDAIEQVKADMEEARPMDRLICGDVGYGKTEVALRAAFKSAVDGKQVMFLVPTTVLAQQHFGTFTERLRDFPIRIEVASRFRSTKAVNAAVKDFQEGRVDILIGTHRLLSRDVRPKDLGLLIVDEEQRFGVKQKELLRQLRLRVDVLSLSATPIPRTLQMSLAGLRDISVIETPPEGRRPVRTYVGEYDEELVRGAIERELERGGQAFFLHNRVETIDETAERVRAICPEARVAVAHGQVAEASLEKVMLDFLRGGADVLVCTTIVEAGLDIPTANTLIVERADQLGLAQLYQIRGRVGRSRERAYAYPFYPAAGALTEEAAARLATLSDYTELGSGFKIAMRDLEIRGAGNLLGEEQSGHVAAVGFEL